MAKQTVEIEAESIGDARIKMGAHIPEGFYLFSENIISDGKPRTVIAIADTTEKAFEKAISQVPRNGNILQKREIIDPEQRNISVDAFDEDTAVSSAKQQLLRQSGSAVNVKSIKLVIIGRKGIFGIGKSPNKYEIEILRQATVEITYKTMAKITFELLDAATLEEQKRLELEEELAEDAAERRRHWEAMEDDEAWRNAHPVLDFSSGIKSFLKDLFDK